MLFQSKNFSEQHWMNPPAKGFIEWKIFSKKLGNGLIPFSQSVIDL